jgi:rubrerythrin
MNNERKIIEKLSEVVAAIEAVEVAVLDTAALMRRYVVDAANRARAPAAVYQYDCSSAECGYSYWSRETSSSHCPLCGHAGPRRRRLPR